MDNDDVYNDNDDVYDDNDDVYDRGVAAAFASGRLSSGLTHCLLGTHRHRFHHLCRHNYLDYHAYHDSHFYHYLYHLGERTAYWGHIANIITIIFFILAIIITVS